VARLRMTFGMRADLTVLHDIDAQPIAIKINIDIMTQS